MNTLKTFFSVRAGRMQYFFAALILSFTGLSYAYAWRDGAPKPIMLSLCGVAWAFVTLARFNDLGVAKWTALAYFALIVPTLGWCVIQYGDKSPAPLVLVCVELPLVLLKSDLLRPGKAGAMGKNGSA
jgi:hypothetical protein